MLSLYNKTNKADGNWVNTAINKMTTLKISNCIIKKDTEVTGIVFNVYTEQGEYLFSFDENLVEFQNLICI